MSRGRRASRRSGAGGATSGTCSWRAARDGRGPPRRPGPEDVPVPCLRTRVRALSGGSRFCDGGGDLTWTLYTDRDGVDTLLLLAGQDGSSAHLTSVQSHVGGERRTVRDPTCKSRTGCHGDTPCATTVRVECLPFGLGSTVTTPTVVTNDRVETTTRLGSRNHSRLRFVSESSVPSVEDPDTTNRPHLHPHPRPLRSGPWETLVFGRSPVRVTESGC